PSNSYPTPVPTRRSSDLIIARMYAARRAGMKKEMFGYVPGGYATVLEHLGLALAQAGVTVRLSQPVTGVESCPGQKVRVELKNGDRKSTRLNSSHVAISY